MGGRIGSRTLDCFPCGRQWPGLPALRVWDPNARICFPTWSVEQRVEGVGVAVVLWVKGKIHAPIYAYQSILSHLESLVKVNKSAPIKKHDDL